MKGHLLVVALLVPAVANADRDCEMLVMTGHPSYPPVAWASKGTIVGAAPGIVARIASSLGVKQVTSKDFGSWEAAQAAARSGQADLIFGIYKNNERLAYLDYVEPAFMVDPVSVVVRAGRPFTFAKWSDLAGKKGVTNVGESYGDEFDAFLAKELTVTRAAGVDKTIATVLDGQADYAILALYPGRNVARKHGVDTKLEFLPKEIVHAEMFVAFSKSSRCATALKTRFATALAAEVASGRVKAALEAADREFAAR